MRKIACLFAVAALLAACLVSLPSSETRAGALTDLRTSLQHQPLYTPVAVWKDCQKIAMCSGCAPSYRCRSCSYQRTCQGGICGWGDVCVWGPYVKVLPRGARIIEVR